jgi:hypothetical protein
MPEDDDAYRQSGMKDGNAMYLRGGEAKDNATYPHGGAAKDNAACCRASMADNDTRGSTRKKAIVSNCLWTNSDQPNSLK